MPPGTVHTRDGGQSSGTRRGGRVVRRAGLVLVAVLALGACSSGASGSASPPATGGRIPVVATTTVLADIVRDVGGDRVTVTSIVPSGVGPEDYEPRPEDARALAQARLIVSNGVGLDDFLGRLISAGGGAGVPRLVLGDGIPAITVDGVPNPHFWFDPTLVTHYYVPEIAAKLSAVDPAGAADYRATGDAWAAGLERLDAELQAKVATIPAIRRKLVTDHDAFPYFARHFGFTIVGVVLPNPGQEPTAADMATLVTTVRNAGVKAVFSEAQFSPKLAETLAQEAGVSVVSTLYSDALGPAPADTYEGMLSWDVDQVVGRLKGTAP